ncbi:MAG: pyrroline-5-carboxylate reductase [bacterium]
MKLAVIGTGQMGRAITSGLLMNKVFSANQIIGVEKMDAARDTFLSLASDQLSCATNIEDGCREASVVLLAVKPQQFSEVLSELAKIDQLATKLFLSIAAGVTLERIQQALGKDARIIRAMPNTPVLVNKGVTAFAGNVRATEEDLRVAEKIFGSTGCAYRVKEDVLDTVTALSGSGPAYFYLFVDCLCQAAAARGLKPEMALDMAARTALGAATMLLETKKSPAELIAQVRSKGGTTEAALRVFEERGLAPLCEAAVDAAWKRSKELASSSS